MTLTLLFYQSPGAFAGVGAYPVNVIDPAITSDGGPGAPEVGDTLTCDDGTWTGDPTITFTYQWCQAVVDETDEIVTDEYGDPVGVEIPTATTNDYEVDVTDVGERLFCIVTGTNAAGSGVGYSNVTDAVTAAAGFAGVGDAVSGAAAYWGLRAYNAAYAAPGTNPCLDLHDNTTGTLYATIAIGTDGSIDLTTAAAAVTAGKAKVGKVYDQVGTNHLIGSVHANRPTLVMSYINGHPALVFNGADPDTLNLIAAAGVGTVWSTTTVARNPGTTGEPVWLSNGTGGECFLRKANSSATWQVFTASAATYIASAADVADADFHAVQCVSNGASSKLVCDGVTSTGTLTGSDMTSLIIGGSGAWGFLTGHLLEHAIYNSALDATQITALDSNQQIYWGPF